MLDSTVSLRTTRNIALPTPVQQARMHAEILRAAASPGSLLCLLLTAKQAWVRVDDVLDELMKMERAGVLTARPWKIPGLIQIEMHNASEAVPVSQH